MVICAAVVARASARSSCRSRLVVVAHSRGFRQRRRCYASVVVSNVYPDVTASAACVRTRALVHGLSRLPPAPGARREASRRDRGDVEGWTATRDGEHHEHPAAARNAVCYATSARVAGREDRRRPFACHPPVRMLHLPPNRGDLMEAHFAGGSQIDLVVFDRFFAEEAHASRFRRRFPDAALVLDMQDMHALRWGRQHIVEAWDEKRRRRNPEEDPFGCLQEVLGHLPGVEDDRLLRELASIHRSDLTLVCSPYELHLLKSAYDVPEEKLCPASFFVDEEEGGRGDRPPPLPPSPGGDDPDTGPPPRFVSCGGFRHAPNVDAVRVLLEDVWPRLTRWLPTATLHVYGAFCPADLIARYLRDETIFVHGHEPEPAAVFGRDGGILLAPLRFGAGIKGKIVDAWTFGMPVVTTPVGSEGMTCREGSFGGAVAATLDDFCDGAVALASRPDAYRRAQADGRRLLRERFSGSRNWERVQRRLLAALDETSLARARRTDTTQAMLWHQSLRSTEYFSRWVELKEQMVREERKRDGSSPAEAAPLHQG